jgi:hypothetical protein
VTGSSLELPGRVMRPVAWAEVVIRAVLAGFLGWIAVASELLVMAVIAVGVAYHLYAIARALSPLVPGSASLLLDRRGFVLRFLWRDRSVSWGQVRDMEIQAEAYLSGKRAGVLVTTGDTKGPTGFVLIPAIFAPGPNQLLAELRRWKG